MSRGYNVHSPGNHIYVGGLDGQGESKNTPTLVQKTTLLKLLKTLNGNYIPQL
ncbi:MAG: hypothetical protein ABI045_05305 [Flavobacteriales bacterium]